MTEEQKQRRYNLIKFICENRMEQQDDDADGQLDFDDLRDNEQTFEAFDFDADY